MATPLFSIVIPTRERADTLRHALRTCLNQECDSYEIVVSDNASSPATKAVVDEIGSPLVCYVRTPRLMAMSSNWDFALSHARGEYIILIGDDDGLLPHALGELQKLVQQSKPRAIRWEPAYYTWPNIALEGQGDYLRIPMGRGLQETRGSEVIADVISFRQFYTALPMIYNSAIHKEILSSMRRQTGRVFAHPIPDVYSGFAIAHLAERFLSLQVPLTVSGQSGSSTGIATLFNRGRSAIDQEFRNLNIHEGLKPDPRIPDLPVFPHVPVADAFVCAKAFFFPQEPIELNRRQLVKGCIENSSAQSQDEWAMFLIQIRNSLEDDTATQDWFDGKYGSRPFRLPRYTQLRPDRLGYDGSFLHLDGKAFGVLDVADAARVCESVLNYRRDGVKFQVLNSKDYRVMNDKVADLENICREQQLVIDGLKKAADERYEIIQRLRNKQTVLGLIARIFQRCRQSLRFKV